MNANQARELATTINSSAAALELAAVFTKIKEACNRGQLNTSVSKLCTQVQSELKRLGYRLEHIPGTCYGRDDSPAYWQISW